MQNPLLKMKSIIADNENNWISKHPKQFCYIMRCCGIPFYITLQDF